MDWIRQVAELRWDASGITNLPWWKEATHADEIVDGNTHPDAVTFEGRRLAEERKELGLTEFVLRFQAASGHMVEDLASRCRSTALLEARVEFCLMAIVRYGFQSRDIASFLNKHGSTISRWLRLGLQKEQDDPDFIHRLNSIDEVISGPPPYPCPCPTVGI